MRRVRITPVLCALLVLAGCAPGTASRTLPAVGELAWREIAGSPLAPRQGALGLWTGREVLLIGGSDEPPCPPNADCGLDRTPLADGAALDPRTGLWRRLASSPHPFAIASGVVLGGTAYVLPGGGEPRGQPGLLAYDIAGDRWRELPVPFDPTRYGIAGTGDRLVAYLLSDETGDGADFALDPSTGTWQRLPDDPLGPSFDRTVAWSGAELVLFGRELVPDPNGEKPAIARAAVLDPGAVWRRLPDSTILSAGPWLLDEGRLVNPTLGGADGGRVDNWGATYPFGGILDVAGGRWSALPAPPGGVTVSAGARGRSNALYLDVDGWLLDTTTQRWVRVPDAPDPEPTGHTLVAAGTEMLLFGGGRHDRPGGTLLNEVWVWSGPA
ncbi:hypothetical protein ACI2K4_33115 [Micromonospora sp. NPDC050397]|uniref:hypothetical protein n=1 Tax=Micromonospora sp. NPDC050397 TaxID=3364279 RepID=UPI00384D3208